MRWQASEAEQEKENRRLVALLGSSRRSHKQQLEALESEHRAVTEEVKVLRIELDVFRSKTSNTEKMQRRLKAMDAQRQVASRRVVPRRGSPIPSVPLWGRRFLPFGLLASATSGCANDSTPV